VAYRLQQPIACSPLTLDYRDRSRREHTHTPHRQFDSQRDPIQMPAGLGHGMSIVNIDSKLRLHEPGSHLEQSRRYIPADHHCQPRLSATTRTGQRHHAGFREQVRHLDAVTAAAAAAANAATPTATPVCVRIGTPTVSFLPPQACPLHVEAELHHVTLQNNP